MVKILLIGVWFSVFICIFAMLMLILIYVVSHY